MHYEWSVIEHYPDGGIWTHYYTNEKAARWGIEELSEAHPGRTYALIQRNK